MMADKRIRITVVGDGDTGKTCMLIVYKDKKFDDYYVPTVFDSYSMIVPINNEQYTVLLSDTAGQEEYDRLRPLSYTDTDVFVICFSVTNRASFMNVKHKWYPEVKHYRPQAKLVLVGTKTDLRVETPRFVTSAEGEEMKKIIKAAAYVECSSKYQWNVDKVFETAMLMCLLPPEKTQRKRQTSTCVLI